MKLWEKFKQFHREEGEGAWARTIIAGLSFITAIILGIVLSYVLWMSK